MPTERYTFAYAEQLAFDLESLLGTHGLAIARGSVLERVCLSVLQTVEFSKRPPDNDEEDIRPEFRALIGLADLAANLVSVSNSPDFGVLLPHLQLLNEGSPLQNVRTRFDDAANKLFELLVACWAIRAGQDVSLEPPSAPGGGSHPDVIATFEGERWGLACKVPASNNPKSIADLVENGARQLVATPSIQRGLVVLNLRSVVEHDRYWPLQGTFGSAADPAVYGVFKDRRVGIALANEEVQSILRTVSEEIAARGTSDLASEALDIVGVFAFAHTTLGVEMSIARLQPGHPTGDAWIGPMPTSLKVRYGALFEPHSKATEAAVNALEHEAALNPMATIEAGIARWPHPAK